MQKALVGLVGFAIGAVLAGGGLWLGGTDAAAGEAQVVAMPAPPTTVAPLSIQTSTSADLGSAVLTPISLTLDGSSVVLEFQLEDRAPPILGYQIDRSSLPGFRPTPNLNFGVLAPEKWTLTTREGAEIAGTTANIRARTARFDVPDDFRLDSIASVRLDVFRQRVPLTFDLTFATTGGQTHDLGPGTSVTLESVLQQSTGTIYRFGIEDPFDTFSLTGNIGMDNISLFGVGHEWVSAGPVEHGIQLTHSGVEVPDEVQITVETVNWLQLPADIEIPVAHLLESAP